MEIIQPAILAIVSVCLILAVKNQRPEIAILLSIMAGVTILLMCIPIIRDIITGVNEISKITSVNMQSLEILMKTAGVVYITEFAAGICKDANEEGISLKVRIAGKVVILGMAMPLLMEILRLITEVIR